MVDEIEEQEEPQPPRGHVRVVYLGPVAPHWEVQSTYGEASLIDPFRDRTLARLTLLPPHDPQFRRNRGATWCATPSGRTSSSSGTSASPKKRPRPPPRRPPPSERRPVRTGRPGRHGPARCRVRSGRSVPTTVPGRRPRPAWEGCGGSTTTGPGPRHRRVRRRRARTPHPGRSGWGPGRGRA